MITPHMKKTMSYPDKLRAALMAGGITWRLVLDLMGLEATTILEGPFTDPQFAQYSRLTACNITMIH